LSYAPPPLPLYYNKVELRATAAARKKHPASSKIDDAASGVL
jgi:hypothetical protein